MNKIIDDLFEQSKEYAQMWEETQYDKGIFISTSDFYKKVNEKFAELIIRECATIARDTDLEDVEGGDSAVLRAAKMQILEHFGVKE